MNSPFPGMDPYIEACGVWGDFHNNLITDIQRQLAETIPDRYLVRSGQRSYLVLADEQGKREYGPWPLEVDEHRESFIEIHEAGREQEPVTVIEMLSPSNKQPNTTGWDLYSRKRQSLLLERASFVEIDLLRGGQKMPMLDRWPDCPCTLLVCRRERAPYCCVWPAWSLKPLPTIPIPLLRPDPDVLLTLQPLVEAIYTRNRYHRSIDYTTPLRPALADAEEAFLAEQLRSRSS